MKERKTLWIETGGVEREKCMEGKPTGGKEKDW